MLYHVQSPFGKAPAQVTARSKCGSPQQDRLRHQIESQSAALKRIVHENEATDTDLAARATSLLLYLEGMTAQDIARSTGLTTNTVQRVRRRFGFWGVHCLADPIRSPNVRTMNQTCAVA